MSLLARVWGDAGEYVDGKSAWNCGMGLGWCCCVGGVSNCIYIAEWEILESDYGLGGCVDDFGWRT